MRDTGCSSHVGRGSHRHRPTVPDAATPGERGGAARAGCADVRSDLRTEIAANRDRIDAVSVRLAGVEERLTRIETLLEERLPARP